MNLPARVGTGLVLSDRVRLTPLGIVFALDTSREEWEAVADALTGVVEATRWGIGDWMVYGADHKYGLASQLAVRFDIAADTVQAYHRAARFFPPDKRRENLSIAHHIEAMYLKPDVANEMLDQAEANNWPAIQLRQVARARMIAGGPVSATGTDTPVSVEPHDSPRDAAPASMLNRGYREKQPDKVQWLRQQREQQAIQREDAIRRLNEIEIPADIEAEVETTVRVIVETAERNLAESGVSELEIGGEATSPGSAVVEWLWACPKPPVLTELGALSTDLYRKAKTHLAFLKAVVEAHEKATRGEA